MPEYLYPGVYVEEVDTGNKPIEGVSTSTVGFFGITERGPTAPTLVTSFADYVRNFGGYLGDGYLPHAIEGFFQNGGLRAVVARVVSGDPTTKPASYTATGIVIDAAGPGIWGNRIAFKIEAGSQTQVTAGSAPNLFKLTIIYWARTIFVPGLDDATTLIDPTDLTKQSNPGYRTPSLIEVHDNLSILSSSGNYFVTSINDGSTLVTLPIASPAVNTSLAITPLTFLSNGSDGTNLASADFTGSAAAAPGSKVALAALEDIEEISILCCPDENRFKDTSITSQIISQCENTKYRFAIIQSPVGAAPPSTHYPSLNSNYAAYYYPWLRIIDQATGLPVNIPPGGHIAGIYARSDTNRNVAKDPANEIISGIDGLQFAIGDQQQAFLNPRGVNCLRYFRGRGNLVWGGRTTSSNPDWKYIGVRRLFIFVEKSIQQGTQWVVFEPNDAPLWARVIRSVSDFLTGLWRDGMLQGATKEQSFFVRCDRTTMTQADIDNGRLIMIIGIAPVKPAEFVIFRIGQWTGGSDISEG